MRLWTAIFCALAIVGLPGAAVAAPAGTTPAGRIVWSGPDEYRPSTTATVALSVTVTAPAGPNGFALRVYDPSDEPQCVSQGIAVGVNNGKVWPVASSVTVTIPLPVTLACGESNAPAVDRFRADLVPNDAHGNPTWHPVATADRILRPVAAPTIRVDHPPAVNAGGSSVFAAGYVNETDLPVHAGDIYPSLRFYDPAGSAGASRLEWSATGSGPWQPARPAGDGCCVAAKSPTTWVLPTLDVPAHGTASFWLRYTPGTGVRTGRVSMTGGWGDPDKFASIDGIDVTNPKPRLAADQCGPTPHCGGGASATPLYVGGGVLALILLIWGIRRVTRATAAARARS